MMIGVGLHSWNFIHGTLVMGSLLDYHDVMNKKTEVAFVASQYKDRPVQVSFYTKSGGNVRFSGTEKAPAKARLYSRTSKA